MNRAVTNGAHPATNGTSATDRQQAATVEENLRKLDRYDVEWYAQVAERNRVAQERREERQRDR